MRHYVCYPSADPTRGISCAKSWMAKGYSICMMLDRGAWFSGESVEVPDALDFHAWTNPSLGGFRGYYKEINGIVGQAFRRGADLVTAIGDDMLPPAQGAEEHSRLYFARFPAGEGVMQCTGDRQGELIDGKVNSERICGSPTFGRAWHKRAFGGSGGFPAQFQSFYADEALKEYAEHFDLLYQEPRLNILHNHWSWHKMPYQWYHEKAQRNWKSDQDLFFQLKALGFPRSEQLASDQITIQNPLQETP